MKWIILAVIAFVLFLVFRRMNREQRITTESSFAFPTATPLPGPGMDLWSQRAPMEFEDFYNRYYAAANLDRDYVRKTLEFIAGNGGVPADRIRPEDRIDEFPKKNLARMVGFAQKMLGGALGKIAEQQGLHVSRLQLDTVDDIIRQFEAQGHLPAHDDGEGQQQPEEDSQWR